MGGTLITEATENPEDIIGNYLDADADPSAFESEDVDMTEEEFDALPEFEGRSASVHPPHHSEVSMSYIEPHMRKALSEHVLETVLESEKISAYYLKRPGQGRMMSTLILFTPEGIVLQGDLTPGQNGNVSTYGYGRGWFSGQLSGSYLCEKFLKTEFRVDLAMDAMKRSILEHRYSGKWSKDHARELWDGLPSADEHDGRRCYKYWSDDPNEDGCDFPAYGYNLAEAGWLCAIQERFAALYNSHAQAKA